MIEKLFVYGSLCEGMVHHGVIKESVKSCRPAVIKGSIYRLDVGYPVYLEKGETDVKGYVIELKPSDILASILDEFHGVNYKQPNRSVYERKTVHALTGSCMEEVSVYALRPKKLPKNAIAIDDGNWEKDFSSQEPLQERFEEEEIQYIEKIGRATGREVIPYTNMTRRLEKKGLVIDKGRRPALTVFGKEVFKYLGL